MPKKLMEPTGLNSFKEKVDYNDANEYTCYEFVPRRPLFVHGNSVIKSRRCKVRVMQ